MVDKGHPILPEIYLDHQHHPKFLIVSSPYKASQSQIIYNEEWINKSDEKE